MMKPRFVRFRMSRYFLQKNSSKNIAGDKSYDLQLLDNFRLFHKKTLKKFSWWCSQWTDLVPNRRKKHEKHEIS